MGPRAELGALVSSTLNRIGKSLVKYLKPLRVAPPHYPGASENQDSAGDPKKRILASFTRSKFDSGTFESPGEEQHSNSEQKIASASGSKDEPTPPPVNEPPQPEQQASWVDRALYLLTVCSRTSLKMQKNVGFSTYQKSLLNRGKDKLQTVGSIIDTVPLISNKEEELEIKKPA